MASNDLKGQLAARAEGVTSGTPAPAGETIHDLLKRKKQAIADALPRTMTLERFARVVVTECRRTPRLYACSPESLLGAVMLAAQLGLEPGPLGHCYFVPFKNKGRLEVQFILGYKGMIHLARRSGEITDIVAREVFANDEFDFEYGLDERLVHKPKLTERGDPIAYYAVARYRDGGHNMLVMSLDDIDKRKARSKAKDSGPWVTDPASMSMKTVIRAMSPYLPLSIEAEQAMLADEGVNTDIGADLLDNLGSTDADVIDVEGSEEGDDPDVPSSGSAPEPDAGGANPPPDGAPAPDPGDPGSAQGSTAEAAPDPPQDEKAGRARPASKRSSS